MPDLIDLMASLPADELARAREKNQRDLARARAEVARLEHQEQQFEMIAAKRERRKKPGRPGKLTPELVLDAAHRTALRTEMPMSAADVLETLVVADGLDGVNVNAVRNHLNALASEGALNKDEETKRYTLPIPDFVPASTSATDADFGGSDDDIPF